MPYSHSWPGWFAEESAQLTARLGPWLIGDIEHVGATAVPGLAAKPILDMLAPVDDLDGARAALPALADLGYRHADHRPHQAPRFSRQQGADDETRTHQLHLTRPGSALWRERLTFRGALREDPALLLEYQDLEQALASGTGGASTGSPGSGRFD